MSFRGCIWGQSFNLKDPSPYIRTESLQQYSYLWNFSAIQVGDKEPCDCDWGIDYLM